MIPNKLKQQVFEQLVVNCFQNCIFTYDSQPKSKPPRTVQCCELLSELYFYLWFPTCDHNDHRNSRLWIAFRIVFLLMIPNYKVFYHHIFAVVNCFQNCIFTYDSQHTLHPYWSLICCELLSELYFYLWFPTWLCFRKFKTLLWIAFRIVFLLMIPNVTVTGQDNEFVVNCFQNCIFTYDSQHTLFKEENASRCELLSELYFYLWFPTVK